MTAERNLREKTLWQDMFGVVRKISVKFCLICDKHFPTPWNYRRHVEQKHTHRNSLKCETCGKTYERESFYKSHIAKCQQSDVSLNMIDAWFENGVDGDNYNDDQISI